MAKTKPRALICDDEADIRRVMELSLHVEGFEVRTIGKLENLRLELERFQPHVLVLDIMLPGSHGDGLETCREMKEKNEFPELKILICSAIARGTSRTERDFKEMSGADDVIFKPFEPLEFRGRVKALLQASQQENNH
jgi:DNA-binding response OmpR family regulator